jgi:hypothetical protein
VPAALAMMILRWVGFAGGVAIIAGTLANVVYTLVLPRNPGRGLSARVLEAVWALHLAGARRLARYADKDHVLALAAPAALLILLAIWLAAALAGYALVLWPLEGTSFGRAIEESGSSMFTLGFALAGRPASVVVDFIAAATGLVIIALQIAYLPALYTAFSRREALVTLLESRAGTPAWGPELLARHNAAGILDRLPSLYDDWERWAADVAESHSTYPALAYFRSPRPLDSWVIGLVAVLDSAALYLALCPSGAPSQARLCLRMGFTCMRDIADALNIGYDPDPSPDGPIALDYEEFTRAVQDLQRSGFPVERSAEESWPQFRGWRVNYESIGYELASRLFAPPALWTGRRPNLEVPGIAPLRPVDRRPGLLGPPPQPRRRIIQPTSTRRLMVRRRGEGHR